MFELEFYWDLLWKDAYWKVLLRGHMTCIISMHCTYSISTIPRRLHWTGIFAYMEA